MSYARVQYERKRVHQVLITKKGGRHIPTKAKSSKRDERRLNEAQGD